MLDIYIGRQEQKVAYLSLPTTPGDTGEAYGKLEHLEGSGEPVLIQAVRCSVPYLAGALKGMNYDNVKVNRPLDFLARRIRYLSKTELDVYGAALAMENPKTVDEMINLSYNLDCYELIPDITDLGKIARSMVEKSHGIQVPIELSYLLDYEKVTAEYFLTGKGEFMDSGLVLKKDAAVLEKVYDGIHSVSPGFEKQALFLMHCYAGGNENIFKSFTLAFPATEERVMLARKALGVENLNMCNAYGFGGKFDALLNYLPVGCELERMNELAWFLAREVLDGTKEQERKLLAVLEAECPRNIDEVMEIVRNMEGYRICPESVLTAEEYAGYVLETQEEYAITPYLRSFIDMERLGASLIKRDGAMQTKYGIVISEEWYCQKLPEDLEVLRLVSPLEGSFYNTTAYEDFEDTSEELDGRGLIPYASAILEKLKQEDWSYEGEKGLARYLSNQLLARRVVRMFPSIQEYEGKLYGILEVTSRGALLPQEIRTIQEDWRGQASDGWGEGFEQREIQVDGGELYVSFYTSRQPFEIYEEEEFLSILHAEENMQMGGIT